MSAPPKLLTKLDPHWAEANGQICGVVFDCPEHMTETTYCRQIVPFTPDMKNKPAKTWQANGHTWQRRGGVYYDDQNVAGFADLTLTPSVRSGCGWHGFITNGVVTSCGDSK